MQAPSSLTGWMVQKPPSAGVLVRLRFNAIATAHPLGAAG
jgi:hypothetical protein